MRPRQAPQAACLAPALSSSLSRVLPWANRLRAYSLDPRPCAFTPRIGTPCSPARAHAQLDACKHAQTHRSDPLRKELRTGHTLCMDQYQGRSLSKKAAGIRARKRARDHVSMISTYHMRQDVPASALIDGLKPPEEAAILRAWRGELCRLKGKPRTVLLSSGFS